MAVKSLCYARHEPGGPIEVCLMTEAGVYATVALNREQAIRLAAHVLNLAMERAPTYTETRHG